MENLIFDIGFHKGEDTLFYLLKGYRVIAVDADPNLINEWQNIFCLLYTSDAADEL